MADQLPVLQVLDEGLDGHARPDEDGRSPENLRVAMEDSLAFHAVHRVLDLNRGDEMPSRSQMIQKVYSDAITTELR